MTTAKKDLVFSLLKAFLIICVLDDHAGQRIGFLSSVFPYNSFYMPFFVFISGYFYKKRGIIENALHKMRRILLPYVVWSVTGNAIAWVLDRMGIVHWYSEWSLRNLLVMLHADTLSSITGPGWFAIMLFYVCIAYNIMEHCFFKRDSVWGDCIWMTLLCSAGMISVWLCMHHYNTRGVITVFCRLVFYLQFYHLGYMFKKHWESTVLAWNKGIVCAFCVATNVVLIGALGKNINFESTAGMGYFRSWCLPLITSITGGLFWYEVFSYIAPAFRDNAAIELIADNSFHIMMIHLLFLNIPNFYVYNRIVRGCDQYGDFDISAFQASAGYRYNANIRLISFFCGLIGSLIVAYAISQCKTALWNRRTPSAESR